MLLRRRRARSLPCSRVAPGRGGPWLLGALAAVLASSACGAGGVEQAGPVPDPLITPSTVDVDPSLLQPLTLLGPCQEVPRPDQAPEVAGLVLPPEAFVTQAREQGGLVNTQGYVEMTPLQLQVWLRERSDLEMVTVEHEVQESETLYSDGTHRVFLKAAAVCELGSAFIAVVADEVDAEAVPTPSGGRSTPAG